MQLDAHTQADFSQALRDLMPPGEAWQWPVGTGSVGATLMDGPAAELARIDGLANPSLAAVLTAHKPKAQGWRLEDYQAVANLSQAGVVEQRKAFAVGLGAGQRLWSSAGLAMQVPLVDVRPVRPFAAGLGVAGGRAWGPDARFYLEVRYHAGVANLTQLRADLAVFKQAHMIVFLVDASQVGGEIFYA